MPVRDLPEKKNHLANAPIDDETRQELVNKRRLGQTELDVDNGKVGTSNSTKPENLGAFDYAHIKVPLPKNLKGSGIFHVARGATPEAYFLMRRSSDGFISATGMFKVAFPWAQEEEEAEEKSYIKTLPTVSKDEIAGNLWIHPQTALELADEYSIRPWVEILLHPSPIMIDSGKNVKSPPTFKGHPSLNVSTSPNASAPAQRTRAKTPTLGNGTILTPASETGESPKQTKSPRKRAQRSASPTKIPAPTEKTPARKIATPKRPTATKRGRNATASASVEPEEAQATKARKPSGRKAKAAAAEEEKVTVKVDSTTEVDDAAGIEETTTKVAVETPARHSTLKLPDDAQGYLDSARKAIDQANKLTADRNETVRSRKRKAADISTEDDNAGEGASSLEGRQALIEEEVPAAKRARLAEIETRRQKLKKRAGLGIAASLATAFVVPFLSNYFGA